MVIGTTLVVVAILVAVIWLLIEFKRFRHKLLALFLIALILFTYISFSVTLKGKDIDFKSVEGLKQAGGLYAAWLGSIFGNFKTLTSNAIHMDWRPDPEPQNVSLIIPDRDN